MTKIGGGAPNIDLGLTVEACEEMDMRTTVICQDTSVDGTSDSALLFNTPGALAIVNVGPHDTPFTLPPVERAIGGETVNDVPSTGQITVVGYRVADALSVLGDGRSNRSESDPESAYRGHSAREYSMGQSLRIVHYVNQFFGGIGGEDKAMTSPQVKEGPVGPGIAVHNALKSRNIDGHIVATVICGDDYAGLDSAKTAREVVGLIAPYRPDLVLAGPAFNAGRYGIACGTVCSLVREELMIPAVTGMYPENPGADMYRRSLHIVKTTDSARGMTDATAKMVDLAYKMVTGQDIGLPAEEGYIPRGLQKRIMVDTIAAKRAVDMMLARLAGQPFETELALPKFVRVEPPAAIKDISSAKIGIVTDGGLVPKGNPDEIERLTATRYGRYSIEELSTFDPADWEVVHAGYDNCPIMRDPNRLIPLDVLRDLEREHVIGKLGEHFYSTCGCAGNLEACSRMGREIAAQLRDEKIEAVILTGT